jgi:hypothetical protein
VTTVYSLLIMGRSVPVELVGLCERCHRTKRGGFGGRASGGGSTHRKQSDRPVLPAQSRSGLVAQLEDLLCGGEMSWRSATTHDDASTTHHAQGTEPRGGPHSCPA